MPSVIVKQLRKIQRDFLADRPLGQPSQELETSSRALIFSTLLAGYIGSRAGFRDNSLISLTPNELTCERLKQELSHYDQSFGVSLFACFDWSPLESSFASYRGALNKVSKLSESLALPDLIGCFEGFARRSSAKKEGVFSTPVPIAHAMVRDVLASLHIDKRLPTFLDPACGSGIFLLEVLQQCSQLLKLQDISSRSEFIQNHIFGVDRDSGAVQMTRLILQLWLRLDRGAEHSPLQEPIELGNNIVQGDSLISTASHTDLELFDDSKLFDWREAFPKIWQLNGGFDAVIGNPPYGLARGEQLSDYENTLLKSIYREYRSGKINKYLAFMARGFELLSRDGVLSLLVPNSWLGIQGGKPIRQKWLKNKNLKRINLYDCAVFDDPSVEAVSFIAVKSGNCDQIELTNYADLEHADAVNSIKLSAEECLKTPDAVIPLRWSAAAADLYQHLRSVSLDLGSPESGFIPLIALQAYAQGKGNPPQDKDAAKNRIFHSNFKGDDATYPYLEGSDVARFKHTWSGHYLKFGPWLAEVQCLERFTGPRILVREIIRPRPYLLAACLVNETCLYNKSVLHILPAGKSAQESIWTLLGILNSKLASFVIGFAGRKSQRKLFPKIVNADLLSFPLAKNFQSSGGKIAKLARKLSECEQKRDPELYTKLNKELDQAVYWLYELRNSQVELLEREYPTESAGKFTGKE